MYIVVLLSITNVIIIIIIIIIIHRHVQMYINIKVQNVQKTEACHFHIQLFYYRCISYIVTYIDIIAVVVFHTLRQPIRL